jgi:hypothetical protein
MRQPPIAHFGPRVARRRGARPLAALSMVFAIACSGCSSFEAPPARGVDANLNPANYKADLMAFLQTNVHGLVGAVSAELAPPMLRPLGTESRYVACMNVAGKDWRREKMFVFYGGEINQFVDATEEACKGAAFAPFPELPAMLAQIRSKQR